MVIMDKTAKNERKTKCGMKIALIIISAVLTVTIIIGVLVFHFINTVRNSVIKDKNGNWSYSLVTITDYDIARATDDDYFSMLSGSKHSGEHSNFDDKSLEDVDYDYTRYSAFSHNGIKIVNATKTDDFKLVLCISSTVTSGNCEIFVYVEDELYQEIAINERVFVTINDVAGKNVYVKVAGESAAVVVEVSRD